MNTAMTSLEALKQSYLMNTRKEWPVLYSRIVPKPAQPQGYSATCRAGELHITANSAVGLAGAIAQLTIALKSGHLEEFLGDRAPRCPWRILWTKDPTALQPARILELGYNAVLTDVATSSAAALRREGIAVALKVAPPPLATRCPLNEEYREALRQALGSLTEIDFIFWESQLLHATFAQDRLAEDSTFYELVQAEADLLQASLPPGCRLLFYVPCTDAAQARQQALWLGRLCDAAGSSTMVSFPLTVGDPGLPGQPVHPFWELLRKKRDPSSTPLLPVFNGGALGLGEGLWPVLPLEILECCRSHMLGPHFAGAIAMTPLIPLGNGLLACSLWVAAQMLWTDTSAYRLVETWCAAMKPEFDYPSHATAITLAGEVAAELSRMAGGKGGTCTSGHVDVVAAKLRLLDSLYLSADHSRSSPEPITLHDYFRYFSRDAWCLLHYHTDRLRLPGPGVPQAVDHSGGFWTRLASAGRTIPSAATVTTLSQPRCLGDDSRMAHIFDEEREVGRAEFRGQQAE